MASPHLDDLNPAQREAATFGVADGGPAAPAPPLLVVAGAGTGKTGALAHRVAHLVLSGADPRRVLLLTFTRRAAEEMARRAGRTRGRALGTDAPLELEWAGTFHGIGARLLRLHAPAVGLDPEPGEPRGPTRPAPWLRRSSDLAKIAMPIAPGVNAGSLHTALSPASQRILSSYRRLRQLGMSCPPEGPSDPQGMKPGRASRPVFFLVAHRRSSDPPGMKPG